MTHILVSTLAPKTTPATTAPSTAEPQTAGPQVRSVVPAGQAGSQQAKAPGIAPAAAHDSILDALSADQLLNLRPSTEAVAKRAYEVFLRRAGAHGCAESDWEQAERELTAELLSRLS